MPRHRSGELQVVRCIALLLALARAKRGVHIRQFAERHGWSWRAVYRDVQTLRAAGVRVEHEHGWYRVPDRWLPSGTVDVEPEELAALALVRQLAPGLKHTAIGRALDRLWSKLSTPGHQPSLPLGDETWFHVGSLATIDYAPHQVVLDRVRDAVKARRVLRIHYRSAVGEESNRIIEPAFVHWDSATEALYVVAQCRTRNELRVFAIHRITRAELMDEMFAPRRDAMAELRKAYRLWPRATARQVILRFSPRVAGEVRERRWHATARVRDTEEGGVVLEMRVAAPEELERVLLGYGADVVVDAPDDLAERIRQRHAEAASPARFGVLPARRSDRPEHALTPGGVKSRAS